MDWKFGGCLQYMGRERVSAREVEHRQKSGNIGRKARTSAEEQKHEQNNPFRLI
ncbi:hypothetical protein [Virgibacillus doumboii]|uniref:hypothetical protein n=1 Tax=Virgibacillus doumboii TaxID=2697503 RepID=UPI0013DFFC15|nr:hypothetical protein [Virgibacillus doumboii]